MFKMRYEYDQETSLWSQHLELAGYVVAGKGIELKKTQITQQFKTAAIVFVQEDDFDVLLSHGDKKLVEQYYLGDIASAQAKATGQRLIMIEVEPQNADMLNKCVNISASTWCTKLLIEQGDPLIGLVS